MWQREDKGQSWAGVGGGIEEWMEGFVGVKKEWDESWVERGGGVRTTAGGTNG